MDKNYIIANLPTVCPDRVTGYTYDNYLQELGGHLGIYKRVPYQEPPHLAMLMCAEDWEPGRKSWAAEVTCTRCGESWHTAWVGGPLKEIAIMVGEDGLHYPVHDLVCKTEGHYLKRHFNGDARATEILKTMKGQIPEMQKKYFDV